jgi:hypothetical protein
MRIDAMARETRQLRAMRPAPVRGVGEMSDQEADLLGAPRTPEEFEDRAQVADVRAAWLAALIRRDWPSHSGHGSGLARAAIVCRLREPRSLTGNSWLRLVVERRALYTGLSFRGGRLRCLDDARARVSGRGP